MQLESKKALEKLEDAQQAITKTIGNLEFNKDSLDTEITSKISQLNELQNSLELLKKDINVEKSKIIGLESEQKGIQSAIDGLKDQISPLQEELFALKNDIKLMTGQKAELLTLVSTKSGELQAIREESERDLSILSQQKADVLHDIQDSQRQLKQEREDLASRKLAADKRDDNLRAREYKATRDEQMIQQNAGLLNL